MGQNIRELRRKNAMTQTELAEKAGVAAMTLSRIERDETEARASTLRKIARALDVHPRDLFDE